MRILFSAVGAYGHLIPLLPLAAAARDEGHQVSVATAEPFHRMVAEAGFEPVAAGGTDREGVGQARAQGSAPASGAGGAAAHNPSALAFGSILPRRAAADLRTAFSSAKPDLVVYETLNPGAAMAAALADVPAVCHGLGRLTNSPTWRAMCELWSATAIELGVDKAADDPVFFGNSYIDICPPSLQPEHVDAAASVLSMRPEGWSQPSGVPAFLQERDRSRPLVYLTFGTVFGSSELFQQCVAELSRLPVDVLVATGPVPRAELAEGIPSNVVIEQWVSQSDVLPYVDLTVSHGGSGTVLGCLAEGVPHLMLPQGADQFSNAQAVSGIGAGRQILTADLEADSIALNAAELLKDSAARERALEVAAEIKGMPTARDTAALLSTLYVTQTR